MTAPGTSLGFHPRRGETHQQTHTNRNKRNCSPCPTRRSPHRRQPSTGHSRPGGPPPPTRAGPGNAAGRPRRAGRRRWAPAPLRSCRRSPRAGGVSARSASHRFPVPEPGCCGRSWPRRRRRRRGARWARRAGLPAEGRRGRLGAPPRCSRGSAGVAPGHGGGAVPGSRARSRGRERGGSARLAGSGWWGRATEQSPERGAGPGRGRLGGSVPRPPGCREAAVG